jgi:hypothetical protein
MKICSLARTMGYEAALRKLNARGTLAILRRCFTGPLRGVAEIYLPYRAYKATVNDRRIQSTFYYAVDAAEGTLDPYEFDARPRTDAWIEIETRNVHPVRLDEDQTRKIVLEKVRRSLYTRGFFRLSHPEITAELIQQELYIPYWAGFYGTGQNVSLAVLNAVRQTAEGGKVRRLVETWLLEHDAQHELNLAF